jgi:hypothetical protein
LGYVMVLCLFFVSWFFFINKNWKGYLFHLIMDKFRTTKNRRVIPSLLNLWLTFRCISTFCYTITLWNAYFDILS